MVTLEAILSGLFSGFVGGILTIEYRIRREEASRKNQWYDDIVRLAEQVEAETPKSYLADIRGEGKADETGVRAGDMQAAYGDIGQQLRERLHSAPPEVDESVLDPLSETARWCLIISREERISGEFLPRVEDAVENSRALQENAKRARDTVGWW